MKSNVLILTALLISTLFFACDTLIPNPPKPENPASVKRIAYGSEPLQNMDLHLPKGHTNTTKVVIMVHGGGWVMGYKPDAQVTTFSGRYGWNILEPLLAEGYACAVIKYRTACYNTIPANFTEDHTFYQNNMMEDIDLVIQHIKDSAAAYDIADDHFQLLGESGGGHIVMTYGVRAASDPALKSVVSMFGPVVLDDQDWKGFLALLPIIGATAPNYMLRSSSNCTSVTNQQVQIFSSLKSFANSVNIKPNVSNPELFPLSPYRSENIKRNTPTFIMNGDKDLLVPPNHADSMLVGLQQVYNSGACLGGDFGCQHKKKIYAECEHGWAGSQCNRNEIMEDIVAWIKAH